MIGSTNFKSRYNNILNTTTNKNNLQNKIINLAGLIQPGKEEQIYKIILNDLNKEFTTLNIEKNQNKMSRLAFAISILREAIDVKKYNSFLNYMIETNPGNATYNINKGVVRMANTPNFWKKWAKAIGQNLPFEFNEPMIRPNIGRPYNNNSIKGYTRQNSQSFKS